MTGKPVRLAIVGLDHWYSAFSLADAAAQHPGAELVAISDADEGRARQLAERVGVERTTARHEELIEDAEIGVIASFVSVDQNPGVCTAAARAGKHLLSVKPLALDHEGATEILQAVREAGVVFLPAESRGRAAAGNQQLKAWVDERKFGRLLTASYSLWSGLPKSWPDNPDSGWFIDPARAPGGGWIDHSIYQIDLLRWLLGDEVREVSGRMANLKYPDLAFEDYGTATITFQGGLIATIEDTWLCPPTGGRTSWALVGTEGAAAFDALSAKLSLAGDFAPFTGWVHTAPQSPFTEGLDHLLALVRGEVEPVATVEDAWRNLAVCRAFYDAARSGGSVTPRALP